MRSHHDMDNEGELTITESSRVPLSILVSAIIVTAGIVGTYLSLKWDVSAIRKDLNAGFGKSMTIEQFAHWREDAAELNPNIHWPRLPQKDAAYGWMLPKDFLAAKPILNLDDLN